jgi:hypothetical protein
VCVHRPRTAAAGPNPRRTPNPAPSPRPQIQIPSSKLQIGKSPRTHPRTHPGAHPGRTSAGPFGIKETEAAHARIIAHTGCELVAPCAVCRVRYYGMTWDMGVGLFRAGGAKSTRASFRRQRKGR